MKEPVTANALNRKSKQGRRGPRRAPGLSSQGGPGDKNFSLSGQFPNSFSHLQKNVYVLVIYTKIKKHLLHSRHRSARAPPTEPGPGAAYASELPLYIPGSKDIQTVGRVQWVGRC